MTDRKWRLLGWAAGAALLGGQAAQGVIIYIDNNGSPTAGQNTSEPPGDRGWSVSGSYGVGVGTPIGPHHFITAKHLLNPPGSNTATLTIGSNVYQPVVGGVHDDPNSDLRIVQVQETFSSFVSLYLKGDELGKAVTVIGRGRAPGAAVSVGGVVKGWDWAASGNKSWGENVISSLPESGKYLAMNFDAVGEGKTGVLNESALAAGDSGGGVFIQDTDNTWKLAGLGYSVDGYFRVNPAQPPSVFTLFDKGGTYVSETDQWGSGQYVSIADTEQDQPTAGYATRLWDRREWIAQYVPDAVPEPSGVAVLGMAMAGVVLRRSRRGVR